MKKFKSISMLLVCLLLVTVLVVGCGSDNATGGEGDAPSRLAVATGGTTGVYYPLGGAFASIISENVDGASANAESTGASVENVNLLNFGNVDFALVQNDISYYAFNGIEMFDDQEPMDNLRGLATLYPETIQIVADASAGINSVEDLRGKRVAVGAPGSGTEANARQILAAYGLTYDDIQADYLSFGEAADNLKDGHVQAAFVTAGTPTAAITDLATTHNINLVSVSSDIAQTLIADYPYYAEVVIPAGTYRNQDEDVHAVAVMAMLAVRADLSEDLVYDITKALFENLDTLSAAHARGGDVNLDTALDGMSLEIHPGAQRYFDEVIN
ncbi:TAXI family TRAP transporter solute-binding subunit [Clostridium formicaceticum]|uniref:Alkanesulfonate transporter substrate-binding subunit n=1 Tax=Clostridium formicaceticum TaxID=1497 RepID=A0AAC9RJS1_9CLOT|nr:TAXI family TRAP transporter solute-binding subunit [Clostridium formicaceticum]AOY76495.1 C4-dicarboxylate ABC transporter substrate-binding protein [Clostridium formicaceticum]ARE86904.1 alkanesulfonate transporter substrate-binding subunit [Clostridium formicaceticum]